MYVQIKIIILGCKEKSVLHGISTTLVPQLHGYTATGTWPGSTLCVDML